MKEQYIQLYEYHIWANERVLNHLKSLPEEIFTKRVDLGFTSIAEILTHLVTADELWFSRIREVGPPSSAIHQFKDIDETARYLNPLQTQIRDCLDTVVDDGKIVAYSNKAGQKCQYSISDIIQHMANHGTYHRGNITTILRFLGYTGVLTDYIAFIQK